MKGGEKIKEGMLFGMVLSLLMICLFSPTSLVHQVKATGAGTWTNQTTLADAINACTVNWTTDASTVKLAMVFNALRLNYYDTLIQQYVSSGDWLDVFRVKRFSEIDGYDSPTIEQATLQALSNMPMLEDLPLTWTYGGNSYYMVYHRFILNAYRYAAQQGQTSKWDKSAAYQELLATYQAAGGPSLGYNPVTLTTFPWSARYYDEAAETLDSFVKLGGNDAGLWDYIQNHFWTGSIYGYNGPNQYECEVGFFAMVIGYYYVMNGRSLTNSDRVYLDLYNKLLVQGWGSVAWGVPGVLRHASSNPQLRLENTLGAIQALQAYVGTSTWETSFVNLLSGSNKAWSALLDSPVYSAGKFKDTSTGSFSDSATAEGMMTLFLEGIIPSTGSLAMPLNDEGYQDICDLSPASLLGFDYANARIRIPVYPGELKFQFGTGVASYVFPSAGVYDVQFDSSWNTVTSVNKVGPLDSQFQYLTVNEPPPPPPNPPVANFTWSPPLPTTGETATFDASSSLSGFNGKNTMPIVLYSWDFGDDNTTTGQIVTHAYSNPGSYTVTLNVTDSEDLTNSTSQTLTVYVPVTFDQAGVGSDFNGTVLNVDGSGYGVGDLPKTFLWNVASNHTFAYLSPLFVSPDGKHYDWNSTNGLSTLQSGSITASSNGSVIGDYLSLWPTANFGWSPPLPTGGETVTFDASSSLLGWNGTQAMPIVLYSWDFGDDNATTTNTSTVTHVYASAGTYNVTLSVTDDEDFTDSTTQTLTVYLQVSISPSSVVMDFGQSQLFTSNVLFGTSPYTYQWYLNNTSVSGATNSTWTFTPTSGGSYTVYVDVTDSVGAQGKSDSANVTVNVHDVAVTGVTFSKTVVGRGYVVNVTVAAADLGMYEETVNVTVYANTTPLASQNVTLSSGNSTNVTFTWNTTGFDYGNYPVSAYAWPVPGETDTANNNFRRGRVSVSIVGDITGTTGWPDGQVNMQDVAIVARVFGSKPGSGNWNPNADINSDGAVNMKDIALVARHFGQHYE